MDSYQGRSAELWIHMLRDPNRKRREQAIDALAHIGQPAVVSLVRFFVHGRGADKHWALVCLGKIGPDAAEAVPVVMKGLRDPHPDVRKAARTALERIDLAAAMRRAGFWRRFRYWCSRLTHPLSHGRQALAKRGGSR